MGIALVLALTLVMAFPAVAQTTGTTEAPDLLSVGNFREGPPTDDGNPQTLVDYTFDQAAYLNGGNRSSFHLVPLNGGDPLDARGIAPASDTEGDEVVTVLFNGNISAADYARGFVDSGIVNSRQAGANADNPFNINQSEPISNNGITENPDLVSVTRDGDQVLYEFDEPLTDDDVIQSTSGLRLYFPQTDTSAIRDAGAQAVKRQNSTTLRAYFGEDLPGGKSLQDAIGGFVVQGTVQAAQGSRGGNNGTNAFDELAPIGDTGAEVCPAPEGAGGTGAGNGPTEAPDLTSVGNFRRGPFTSQFTPTTCVDFTFDQVAYLNGGDKSNFNLVPLNAGDALSGSTNVNAESDQEGDNIVTVVFPGDLSPADFARGYVDTGVVNSNPNNIGNENPANINQAADITPNTATENPDLVRVRRGSNSYLFEFDEALTDDDVVQNNSGLRIYFPETEQSSTIPDAGAIRVERVNSTTLRAFYGEDLPEGYTLGDAVGAFAQQGTVQAAQGSRGGNDGANAFDEVLLRSTCTITGTPDADVLTGTSGRDVICGLGGDDEIRAGGGNDEIRAGTGDDVIFGGPGADRIFGQPGEDRLYGNGGNDVLRGGADQDRLVGGIGDDNIAGGDAVDRIFGQSGDDNLYGQAGDDVIRGGVGADVLVGASGADNLVGNDGRDRIYGNTGPDVLRGSNGDDILLGGRGEDNLGGGSGSDRLLGEENDDYLNTEDGVRGNDLADGGTGRDACVTDRGDTRRNCP